ncbi:MAG: peptidase M48 [Holophagae bacterium]|nr:MAG: peptidase M48 [Holophagae bacterium]
MNRFSGDRIRTLLATAAAAVLLLGGCAVNPATGQRQLALISEQQEIALGQQEAQNALAQFGRYDDAALQEYVAGVGRKLAAASERPELPWTFTVVDDPMVNAFALPGGPIFVTRGILAHFGSEAELASVLGHEIGHVTARHSVEQMSSAQLANLGLGVAMIASEGFRPYAGLAMQGMQLMFLKFSRDDESQSDELGLRYVTRTGYDPNQMPKMFATLDRISAAQGEGGRIPVWASTHPNPDRRAERTVERIAALPADQQTGTVDRDGYLRHVDGIVFGDDPRQGYFVGQRFYHPELAFRLDFPDGWKTINTRQYVAAIGPEKDAVIMLAMAKATTVAEATQAFFAGEGIERGPSWRQGFTNFRTVATQEQPNVVRGLIGFLEHGGRVYQLVGYTAEARWATHQPAMEAKLATFRAVTDRRHLEVSPKRVELVELPDRMTLATFNQRFPSTVDLGALAIVNGVEETATLERGTLIKRIGGGELPDS